MSDFIRVPEPLEGPPEPEPEARWWSQHGQATADYWVLQGLTEDAIERMAFEVACETKRSVDVEAWRAHIDRPMSVRLEWWVSETDLQVCGELGAKGGALYAFDTGRVRDHRRQSMIPVACQCSGDEPRAIMCGVIGNFLATVASGTFQPLQAILRQLGEGLEVAARGG